MELEKYLEFLTYLGSEAEGLLESLRLGGVKRPARLFGGLPQAARHFEVEMLKENLGRFSYSTQQTKNIVGYTSCLVNDILERAGVSRHELTDVSRSTETDRRIDELPELAGYSRANIQRNSADEIELDKDREIGGLTQMPIATRRSGSGGAKKIIAEHIGKILAPFGFRRTAGAAGIDYFFSAKSSYIKFGLKVDDEPFGCYPIFIDILAGPSDTLIFKEYKFDFRRIARPITLFAPYAGIYSVASSERQVGLSLVAYEILLTWLIRKYNDYSEIVRSRGG
jgi:hypothetical protein